jgi:AraC-like DNA-binding protein
MLPKTMRIPLLSLYNKKKSYFCKQIAMHFQYIKPSPVLSQYIKHYWVLEASASEGEVCERVIPTGNIEMMFHYRKPFVCKLDGVNGTKQPRSLISGMSSFFSDVATNGDSGVVAVTFLPLGACHFLPFPMLEIENMHVGLNDIFSSQIREIEERICLGKTLDERIKTIELFLTSKLKPEKANGALLIKEGISLINLSKGTIQTETLSKKLYTTPKTLERKFMSLLGKSPKQFSKIVRFQSIIQDFKNSPFKSLTETAYEFGYFDQAHFIKDFKNLSGYTPKEFLSLGPCNADYFN